MITTTDFGTLCDGRTVRLYTLKNDAIELSVTDYGSTLVRLLVPDKNGKPTDVVLGYDDLAGYVADDTCFGNNVGRSANRIGGASFTLNGTEYKLAANDGENNLHSGPDSYSKRIWNVAAKTDTSITFSLESPHTVSYTHLRHLRDFRPERRACFLDYIRSSSGSGYID